MADNPGPRVFPWNVAALSCLVAKRGSQGPESCSDWERIIRNPACDSIAARYACLQFDTDSIAQLTTIVVKHLTTFIRSPTWISTTLGQEFAGPNGANFQCK
jgi:hypothetical protein